MIRIRNPLVTGFGSVLKIHRSGTLLLMHLHVTLRIRGFVPQSCMKIRTVDTNSVTISRGSVYYRYCTVSYQFCRFLR
jgi:hypothetical protein